MTKVAEDKIITDISILGSGWLGLPLAEYFSGKDHGVKASTRTISRLDSLDAKNIKPFMFELGQRLDVTDMLFDSDVLIINIPSKDVLAFKELSNFIAKTAIKKVLFVSSTSVYKNLNRTIEEDKGLENTDSPLWQIEQSFLTNTAYETTILRFGGLIGKERHPGRFFKAGRSLKDPDARVNLIHLDDCIQIIYKLIKADIWNEEYNCCTDTHPTKREFYTKATLGYGLNVPEMQNSSDNDFKIISNKKIKNALNYEFKYSDLMTLDLKGKRLKSMLDAD